MENNENYINVKRYPWLNVILWSFLLDIVTFGMFFFNNYIDFSISYDLIRCAPVFLIGITIYFLRKKLLLQMHHVFVISFIATFLTTLFLLVNMYMQGVRFTDGFVFLAALLISSLIIFIPFVFGYVIGLIIHMVIEACKKYLNVDIK